jgi:hypothetical protein
MEGDLSITYSTVERVAVSVTSPDIGDNNNILVVALTESPKGSDQAHVILNLLDYYEVVDQIFAICCDNTSLNTAFSGAICVPTIALNIFILWILCRYHICEVNISHFMEELTSKIFKAQGKGLYVGLQKAWPSIKPLVDKIKNVVRFNWSKLKVGRMAFEALGFGKRALAVEHLQRETVGSCPTICILHWKRGSKLPLPLTWCVP